MHEIRLYLRGPRRRGGSGIFCILGTLAVLASLVTPVPALAQDQAVLVGRVLDRFNQPVSGAAVHVVGSNLRTTTDSSGNYRLRYAPASFVW